MKLRKKRLFLLDMDGTIYIDEHLFDGVVEFLDYIRAIGGHYLFLTNNSSQGVEGYLDKLYRLGVPATRDNFLTSVDAAIACLQKEYPNQKCYVQGTRSFYAQLQNAGIPVTDTPDSDVDILLSGFDRELTFQKLEDSCILLNRGVKWLATNPDWVCPTWYGSVPDCGSVCRMLTTATGRKPRFIGKPQPEMVRLAMRKTGFAPEETVVIGDRIYTDIACGVNAGITSILVFSGETTRDDLAQSAIKPTFSCDSITDLWQMLKK